MDPDVSSNMKHARVFSLEETGKAWAGTPGKAITSGHAGTDDYGKTKGQPRRGGACSLAMPRVRHILTERRLPSRKKRSKAFRIALCSRWRSSARIPAASASRGEGGPLCCHSRPARQREGQQIIRICQGGRAWSSWQRCSVRPVESAFSLDLGRPKSLHDVAFATALSRRS